MQGKKTKKPLELLEKHRKEIDLTDEIIGQALLKRAGIIKKIAKYKKKHGLNTQDLKREENILKKFKAPFQKAIFKKILEESKKVQRNHNK